MVWVHASAFSGHRQSVLGHKLDYQTLSCHFHRKYRWTMRHFVFVSRHQHPIECSIRTETGRNCSICLGLGTHTQWVDLETILFGWSSRRPCRKVHFSRSSELWKAFEVNGLSWSCVWLYYVLHSNAHSTRSCFCPWIWQSSSSLFSNRPLKWSALIAFETHKMPASSHK